MTTLLATFDANGNLDKRFNYADARTPNSYTDASGTYYLAYDQVGSLRAVTNTAGSIVKELSYDSFGNILSDSNPSVSLPFAFAGGLYDKDTNLVRFGYRDFDPVTGKWTAKDPIGFDGGDSSLYGYVLNDPVNLVDPLGLYDDPRLYRATGSPVKKLVQAQNASITTGVLGSTIIQMPSRYAEILGSFLLAISALETLNKHLLLMELDKYNANNACVDLVTTLTAYPKNPTLDFLYDQVFTNASEAINKEK